MMYLLQSKNFRRAIASACIAVVLFFALAPALETNALTGEEIRDAEASAEFEAAEAQAREAQWRGTSLRPDLGSGCTIFSSEFLGCVIYWILDTITDLITTGFVSFASALFEGFVNYSLANPAESAFVKTGFAITASVANMFFILILLWIAIATILDYDEFSARKLLPRLIIAALLINFSLPIGSAFIGLSNGIAKIFYDQAKDCSGRQSAGIPGLASGGWGTGIAQCVMNISKVADLKNATPPTATSRAYAETRSRAPDAPVGYEDFWNNGFSWSWGFSLFPDPKNSEGALSTAFQAIFWKLLTVPILIFVLFAGAVMLLIRTLALAIVLVLGPMAFLFMILPATQRFNSDWWSALMKWAFFFPAFMFFLMLSLTTGSKLGANIEGAQNIGAFPQYLLTVGLLIASIIVGQKMGITGASTFMGWSKKAGAKVGGWVKGSGKILASKAADKVLGTEAAQHLAERKYARGLLRPVESISGAGRKVAEKREEAAVKRRAVAAKASPEYRWALMRGMGASERADFIKETKDRELEQMLSLPTITPDQTRDLVQQMKQFDQDKKVLQNIKDLTTYVEVTSGLARGAAGFQEAFNSWLQAAPVGELRKRVSASDIHGPQTNQFLQNAINTVADDNDLRDLVDTQEKAQALREHMVDLGGRQNYDDEITLGYSEAEASERALQRAIAQLRRTNDELAQRLTDNAKLRLNIIHGRPLGRQITPIVVTTPVTVTAPPGGTTI